VDTTERVSPKVLNDLGERHLIKEDQSRSKLIGCRASERSEAVELLVAIGTHLTFSPQSSRQAESCHAEERIDSL